MRRLLREGPAGNLLFGVGTRPLRSSGADGGRPVQALQIVNGAHCGSGARLGSFYYTNLIDIVDSSRRTWWHGSIVV
jgi:hypothetical protein